MKHLQGAVCIAALWLSPAAFAAEGTSDREIAQKLVGAWRVPTSSTDYGPVNAHMVEIFKPDGTYGVYSFQEGNCKALRQVAVAKWIIKGGVLNSFYSAGGTDQDDVLNISDDRMTLHSHAKGTTVTRVKIDPCAKLTS